MNDNDTMTRIADARIARALRMLAKVVDDPTRETSASDDMEAIATALEAPAPASEPPTMKGCGTCGDQWGLCDCPAPASKPPAAPAPCAHEHRDLVLKCWYCWREDKPEPPAAPEPLPPLEGPRFDAFAVAYRRATDGAFMDTTTAGRKWERIARKERAARERERAEAAALIAHQHRAQKSLEAMVDEQRNRAEKAERERNVAQATAARFEDRGETIFDHQTGLEWEKATRGTMPWQEAADSCHALRIGGYEDWRLPTVQELQSIVDYERSNPACDPIFGALSDNYWSSTTIQSLPDYAWSVYFYLGYTIGTDKTDGFYVRAVRADAALRALGEA